MAWALQKQGRLDPVVAMSAQAHMLCLLQSLLLVLRDRTQLPALPACSPTRKQESPPTAHAHPTPRPVGTSKPILTLFFLGFRRPYFLTSPDFLPLFPSFVLSFLTSSPDPPSLSPYFSPSFLLFFFPYLSLWLPKLTHPSLHPWHPDSLLSLS